MSSVPQGHQRIDQRSLALHCAIAKKLRTNPSLVDVARNNLDRWSQRNGRSQPYWDAWRKLLNQPLEDVLASIVEVSERMAALRQATPFAGVLSPAERWAVYAGVDAEQSRTT
jgi:hypothetical protein